MDKRIIFALLLLTACVTQQVILHGKEDVAVAVEIADSPEEQRQGLMYRTSLAPDAGMLFVFPKEQEIGFWMKNTKIPLDMFFIDGKGVIVDINHNAQPCKEEPCKVYRNNAKYVLETNAGFAVSHQIEEGNSLTLPKLV